MSSFNRKPFKKGKSRSDVERQFSNNKLILYNDDHNTFDSVIELLNKHCDFESIQSEQLALLAHFKGVVTLKNGQKSSLEQICIKLVESGLTAEVI